MKIHHIFLFLLILTNAHSLKSQDTEPVAEPAPHRPCQFGFKVGANYSGIFDKESAAFGSQGKFGLASGAYFSMPIGKTLGFQPELIFSQKGFQANNESGGNRYNVTRTTSYFDIPLYLTFQPVKNFTLLAGPLYAILVHEKNMYSNGETNLEQQASLDIISSRRNTMCLSAGFDITMKKYAIGARVGYDAFNKKSDNNASELSYKNAWLQLTLASTIYTWGRMSERGDQTSKAIY